ADEGYWDEVVSRYEAVSLYAFLRDQHWSPETIASFAVFEGVESILHAALPEILTYEIPWRSGALRQIVGGMDRPPHAFLAALQGRIRLGAEVVALDYTVDAVTVHIQTAAGREQVAGDAAILTIPFSVLRFIDVLTPFSAAKQRAIRQLHYVDIVKTM